MITLLHRGSTRDTTNDVVVHTNLLTEKSWSALVLSMNGLKLGDPESDVDTSQIKERRDDGWIVLDDDSRLKISEGKVVIMVPSQKTTVEAGLDDAGTVEQKLGTASGKTLSVQA